MAREWCKHYDAICEMCEMKLVLTNVESIYLY